jgi:hypothetical protein
LSILFRIFALRLRKDRRIISHLPAVVVVVVVVVVVAVVVEVVVVDTVVVVAVVVVVVVKVVVIPIVVAALGIIKTPISIAAIATPRRRAPSKDKSAQGHEHGQQYWPAHLQHTLLNVL